LKPFSELQKLINPENVVVVGASPKPNSQGGRLYENLVIHSRLKGTVFAVNPAYNEISGAPCWPSIANLPVDVKIDVALIIVGSKLVLDVLKQCVDRNIPFAVVMSSGFSEAGGTGSHLESEIADLCKRSGLRVYGPNCPGFVNVRDRIGMTFSPAFKEDLHSGRIGLATQGGGLGRNLLQGLSNGPGVGLWFSAGNEVDLEVPDFIEHMAKDPEIDVIGVLMEGVKNGRRLTQAFELARMNNKPVVMLKIGHSKAGVEAAQSHTASIAGSAAVNSGIFSQFGVLEVYDLNELLATLQLLSRDLAHNRKGLCVYTFSGGTAALAADIAGTAGLPMPSLTEGTRTAIKTLLPDFASIDNPVDTTADILRNQDAATECLRLVSNDPNISVVLLPIPMDYGEVTDKIAESIVQVSKNASATLVPVWMSRKLGEGFKIMEKNGLSPFYSITEAIRALKYTWPTELSSQEQTKSVENNKCINNYSAYKILDEVKSKQLLKVAGIDTPPSLLAQNVEEAVEAFRKLNKTVVLKIVSPDIAHKTDIGGVKVGLNRVEDVRAAFEEIFAAVKRHAPEAKIEGFLVEAMLPKHGQEVLIGVHTDEAFGLIITFGLGGVFVEILHDVSHRMLPINHEDARSMILSIKNHETLRGTRGAPCKDLVALETLLLKVSDFAYSNRDSIVEMELNPVWVGVEGEGAIALDALIVMR